MSRPFLASAETKISAGVSRVTGAAELIEMGQYLIIFNVNIMIPSLRFV
jgi:hypothetical protein